MDYFIVTNNIDVKDKFDSKLDVVYLENKMYIDVLLYVRDKIHLGHKLLTHVLSGSIKPNETPYKSVILTKSKSNIEFESLEIIEASIQTYNKFYYVSDNPKWTERLLCDFRVVDLSLISNVISNSKL